MAKPRQKSAPSHPVGVPQQRPLGPVLGILALVLAVVLIVALVIAQPWKSDGNEDPALADAVEFQAVTVTGTPLSQDPDAGAADTSIGTVAPTLNGKTFTGEPLDLKASDKPKIVMFFAHWCPHCRKEVPLITDWLADNGAKHDAEYVAISTGASSRQANFPPSKWFAEEKFPLKVMADSSQSSAANAYGLKSYPYLVALDKDNKLVARTTGELTADQITQFVNQVAPTK